MHYLNFAGWLVFATWALSDMVPRYVVPLLHPVYDTLEDMENGASWLGRLGTPISLFAQILLSLVLTWVLTGWAAWCVLRCMAYTQDPATGKALYFITGFVCCEYALARIARADRYRGFFLSVFHFTMAMGAFVVYSINPAPIKEVYPWLVRWMGLDL